MFGLQFTVNKSSQQ